MHAQTTWNNRGNGSNFQKYHFFRILQLMLIVLRKNLQSFVVNVWLNICIFTSLIRLSNYWLFGHCPNRVIEIAFLIQSCSRHAIHPNVKMPSKQAKWCECLPHKRVIQGACWKESSASRVLDFTFTISKLLQQRNMKHNSQQCRTKK